MDFFYLSENSLLGVQTLIKFAVATYVYLWRVLTSYVPIGTNIYEHDWDLVIILDACRVDGLKQIEEEYSYLSDIDVVTSVGSTSPEWIDNTFTLPYVDQIRSTSYITANAFSSRHVRDREVNQLETAETRNTIYDRSNIAQKIIKNNTVGGEFSSFKLVEGAKLRNSENRQQFHPDLVTAHAIRKSRQENPEKMIVHYMQPHAPYIADAVERGYYKEYEKNPFGYLKSGGDLSTVWESYISNLRLVLDSVENLLENVDAENVIITSDHGELFGEWGLYSHIYGVFHPDLRNVPWVETTAEDNNTVDPEELIASHNVISDDEDVESRLSALGYI